MDSIPPIQMLLRWETRICTIVYGWGRVQSVARVRSEEEESWMRTIIHLHFGLIRLPCLRAILLTCKQCQGHSAYDESIWRSPISSVLPSRAPVLSALSFGPKTEHFGAVQSLMDVSREFVSEKFSSGRIGAGNYGYSVLDIYVNNLQGEDRLKRTANLLIDLVVKY